MSITTQDTVLIPATADTAERGPSQRGMEIATAVVLMAVGGIGMMDSLRIGAGWAADGPQSGYFPFWLGAILALASLGNLVVALRDHRRGAASPRFATWGQLKLVSLVFVPTAIYVAVIPFVGIYASSAVLVAYFMRRFGEFRWVTSLLSGTAAAVIAFAIFEIWFLVALPKGPIETALGY
jgi:putative tricarboxylic transport membrane protein